MGACKASIARQLTVHNLKKSTTYLLVHSCMAIPLVKLPNLPLVDHSILFCIKMIHLVTGLFLCGSNKGDDFPFFQKMA